MFELDNDQILPLMREHGFWTWSAQGKVNPIAVERAEGVYFWDIDGKRYLDFNSMQMCVNVGHGEERITKAMADQLRQNSGRNKTKTVKSSRRPSSMAKDRTHLALLGKPE